jgi:hypothetical protein
MNRQTTPSALTEEVSKNNDPKRPKAKQIFLGIDAHLARKKDNSAIQGVQSFSVEELLLPGGVAIRFLAKGTPPAPNEIYEITPACRSRRNLIFRIARTFGFSVCTVLFTAIYTH